MEGDIVKLERKNGDIVHLQNLIKFKRLTQV